ncbi:MAG: pentapeptide repeat-containing protein [Anaerolineales bacterium]|nr:pentapeptide repeat-containing protein [Anaerolineales bacterium]
MPKVFRERPDLENSNFRGQNLAQADFRNAGLSGADFSRANLRQADFSGADLQGTKFRNADLRGATFIKASGEAQPGAGSTDFSEAKIQGANFTEATLTQANFSGVQAGLSQGWAFVVIFCAGLFSLLSAFPAVLTGVFTTHFFLDSRRQPSGLTLTATGLGAILLTVALRTVLNYFWARGHRSPCVYRHRSHPDHRRCHRPHCDD